MKPKNLLLLAAGATAAHGTASASAGATKSKPNILFILVDDLGWGDLSCQYAADLRTPNIDTIFETGVRCDNFYANSNVSSPSRAALMTGRFPATADGLLAQTDFSVFVRDDALDSGRMARILDVLAHTAGGCGTVSPSAAREGALITVERFVGRPAHWSYWSTRAAEQLNIAAILCWLGDYLAGAERRTLQSCPEAMQLAAAWQAALFTPLPQTAQRPQPVQSRPVRRAPAVENKRWQSILAVLATV